MLDIDDWRTNRQVLRTIARETVLAGLEPGANSEVVIEELKSRLRFRALNDEDKNRVHVLIHLIRSLVGGWRLLDVHEQRRFRSGTLVPSTALKIVKERKGS